jgi:porin
MKAGRVDANTEFAAVENGGDFLNSSAGYSPTILPFPSYPQPRPGVLLMTRPAAGYSLGIGVFDIAHAGAMSIVEAGRGWTVRQDELEGRLAGGIWHQNGPVPSFHDDVVESTHGFYFVLEQSLWTRGAARSDQTVSAFLQYGQANGEVSEFTHHLGSGIVLSPPLVSRPHDSAGVGASWVRLTQEPAAGFQKFGELTVEAFYKIRIAQLVSLAPDVQYIHNPGGLRCQRDAIVFTPRLTLTF